MTTTTNPAPVTTSDAERAAFEAWAGTMQSWVPNVDRLHPSGPYKSLTTASAWSAWQARATLPIDFKQATDQGGWQPIATAPTDEAVLVYTPPQPGDWPDQERIELDCLRSEDDAWNNHSEHYEHFVMIGGSRAGGPDMECAGPSEKAPYTHWFRIPAVPAAPTLLGVADGDAVGGKSGGAK